MNDSEQQKTQPEPEDDEPQEEAAILLSSHLEMDVFLLLRDVVRLHYLWQCDGTTKQTKERMKELGGQISLDHHFRLVGDIEVVDDVFEITLWLQDSLVFTIAEVDIVLLDTLQLDLGQGTLIARELTKQGLEYHIIAFGNGVARQYCINIMGPRMQQIRDLGTLVAPAIDRFSA